MTTYLLDFTQTPLKPAAGGQLHLVGVGDDPDCEHDGIEAAITHLVKSFGLVGETDRFVPKARVWHSVVPRYLASVTEVQVEPASAAPDYDPDPVKPTEAEVLAAFPLAKDITVTGHTTPRRTFTLHQTRFIVALSDNDHCHVENMDKDNDLEFYRYDCPLAWVAAVRVLGRLVLANEREEIARLSAEAAALAAALGDTP